MGAKNAPIAVTIPPSRTTIAHAPAGKRKKGGDYVGQGRHAARQAAQAARGRVATTVGGSPAGSHRPLLAVALVSLALNLAGIAWGLPARWHPDEKADVAARMARANTLEPDSFINPSLPLYVEWPLLWMQSRVAGGGGRAADPLLLGRILSALAGAGAVFVIGLAAGRLRRDLGLLAAASLPLVAGW